MATELQNEAGAPGADLRLYARFECTETAQLHSDGAEKSFSAKVVDVGLGGVQLHSTEPLPADMAMTLRIEQDGQVVLKVPGKVKYCSKADKREYASGFKFMPVTHEDRVEIAQFVHTIFQRQWEILSN